LAAGAINLSRDTRSDEGGSVRAKGTPRSPDEYDFEITLDTGLSIHQVKAVLEALASFYRACGGVGSEIDPEFDEALVKEPDHVGTR
jgi:hypothetical protein